MNKKVIVENLEQLIEEHKKEKMPYKTYEFDSDSYTLLLIDINKLKKQLEEKDKVIDEAINYINKHRAGFVQPMKYIELSEILERGKN